MLQYEEFRNNLRKRIAIFFKGIANDCFMSYLKIANGANSAVIGLRN